MSQTFKGDVTNNVVELNLQAGATNIGTPTVAYDGTNNGEISVQVMGDVDGSSGFQNDSSLKGLVIGTSCTSIGSYAFNYCSGFTGSLTIPNSVTTIGTYAFHMYFQGPANNFSSLTIGNSVTTIGSWAFYYNNNMTGDLVFPDSVTSIGSYAFYGCSGFTAVYINSPASSFIGSGAFAYTTFSTIYTGPNATGYTSSFQGRTGLTISPWTNYPNIP